LVKNVQLAEFKGGTGFFMRGARRIVAASGGTLNATLVKHSAHVRLPAPDRVQRSKGVRR
jgi:hypothetical protein